jgi:hypothetical protein
MLSFAPTVPDVAALDVAVKDESTSPIVGEEFNLWREKEKQ